MLYNESMNTQKKPDAPLSVARLRDNLYAIFNRMIETGESTVVIKNGYKFVITNQKKQTKFDKLQSRPGLNCDPQEIIETSWDECWSEDDSS